MDAIAILGGNEWARSTLDQAQRSCVASGLITSFLSAFRVRYTERHDLSARIEPRLLRHKESQAMFARKTKRSWQGIGLVALLVLTLSAGVLPPAAAQGQTPTLPADLFVLTDQAQVMHIAAGSGFAAAVTPANQPVIDFGVAPDGQWIAYRSAAPADGSAASVLAITSVSGGSGEVLEFDPAQPPITGRGQTVAWSPDASAIAYTTPAGLRFYLAGVGEYGAPAYVTIEGGPFLNLIWSPGGSILAAEAENNVWSLYRRDGTAVTYAGQVPDSAGLAWVREGVVAVAPSAGGLLTLDVRDGTQAALLDASVVVSQPTLVRGDRLVFFVHDAPGQRFAARRFGTVSVLGGDYEASDAALELTTAMHWLPDGVALLGAIDDQLTLIEPRTNTRRQLVQAVTAYTWGPLTPTEISGLIMPEDLYFLGRDPDGLAQLWRLPADGRPVEQVTREPRNVIDFALAPDGSQIAYTSGGNLIVADRDGNGGRVLSPVGERPGAGGQPAWSPDGQLIAFVRDGIWLVPAIGGGRTELITDVLAADTPPDQVRVYMTPRWSPDGTQLLVSIGYYEGMGLGLLPATGGEVTPLPTTSAQGGWLPNGQVLTWDAGYGMTTPGLYLVDPADLTGYITILDDTWHVSDVTVLAPEAAVILSAPGGGSMGPGAVQPYLVPILPDALPFPQGRAGLLEAPALSGDGKVAAGLRASSYGDFGLEGRLVVIHLENGERFAVETPGDVWGLAWGGAQ